MCFDFCDYTEDPTQVTSDGTDAQNSAISGQFCASGYCNLGTASCDVHGTAVDADCSTDPDFYCTTTSTGQALTCDATTLTCQLAAVPSGRARARRNLVKINSCPQGHESCSIEGSSGFECIDTLSSLEQCGGCASSGKGVDCTSLPGVAAVGCVEGSCAIW